MLDTNEHTSSRGSLVGNTPSTSQESPTTSPSGRGRARASRSPSPEMVGVSTTPGTSGPSSSASSRSQDLCSFLASRLQSELGSVGSPEYRLTLNEQVTPSGLRVFQLQAWARRIPENGSTGEPHGWGPPSVRDWKDSGPAFENDPSIVEEGSRLPRQAVQVSLVLSGYPTPTVVDAEGRAYCYDQGDHNKKVMMLPGVAAASGPSTTSPTSPTGSRGALNPALSRWLMGYPVEWCTAAILAHRRTSTTPRKRGSRGSRGTATPSSRKSRRLLSGASLELSVTLTAGLTDEFEMEW